MYLSAAMKSKVIAILAPLVVRSVAQDVMRHHGGGGQEVVEEEDEGEVVEEREKTELNRL